MLYRLSSLWARVEITLAATLAASITGLILLNVVTRAAGNAIYWGDEAATYAMVWMTFLAASAALHFRQSVAVTLVSDLASATVARAVARFVDGVVFVFALVMLWVCWTWFMPLELAAAGWDVKTFQGSTFNLIYAELTNMIGVPKVWVWLVMPLSALGTTLHAAANLLNPGKGEKSGATS